MSRRLGIGDIAPNFELEDDRGQLVRLSDALREGTVVLYFYPMNFTPACTKEACMFRDVHDTLAGRGIRILGVSPQRPESHAKFRERHRLPFPLLSDGGKSIARAYGAVSLLGLYTKRVSYWIGQDGRILDTASADWSVTEHEAFARRVLAAMAKGSSEDREPGVSDPPSSP